MHQCFKCGQEFEGNFCPKCGNKYEESKICPTCGATLDGSVNFCNNCGYRFDTAENRQNAKETKSAVSFEFGEQFYRITNKILKWSPCVLFLLFAVLNFVFMSLSAYSAFGMDMGSIYKLTDADYKFTATVLIVVCSLSAFYALAYPLLLGKRTKLAHILAFVMYVLALAVSCAMHIQIKKGDWTVEPATKLLIAFAVVFGVLAAAAIAIDATLTKRSQRYADAKNTIRDSSQPTFAQKAAHHIKSWYSAHKKAANGTIIGVCSAAVLCVLVFAVIIPVATNIFRVGKVSKINLGDSKEQVIKIIGEPYGGDTEANAWVYYGDKLVDLMKRQDELNKQMDAVTDLEQLGKLTEQQIKLDEQMTATVDKYIAVGFDSDEKVTSVTYDATYNKLTQHQEKEVKNITVGDGNTVNVIDVSNNTVNVRAEYADGSYKMYTLPSNATASELGETIYNFPSSATLAWQDNWGQYSKEVSIDESNYKFNWSYDDRDYTLKLSGNLPSKRLYELFQIENYPWIEKDYEIRNLYFYDDVTDIPDINGLVQNSDVLEKITVDSDNEKYSSLHGVLFDKNRTKVIYVPKAAEGITQDTKGNIFYQDYSRPYLIYTVCTSDELELPYFNNGNYRIYSNILEKFTKLTFDNQFTDIKIDFYSSEPNKTITTVTIPATVSSISDSFYGLDSINAVYYKGALTDWCKFSFMDRSYNPLYRGAKLYINDELLTELVIPENITEIKGYAFFGCESIKNVVIPNNVVNIGSNPFANCKNIETIYVNTVNSAYRSESNCLISTAKKEIIAGCKNSKIPTDNSVTNVGDYAFYGCNLTSITIPENIVKIGRYAFAECPKLTEIKYNAISCLVNEDYQWICNSGNDGIKVNIGKNVIDIPRYFLGVYSSSNIGLKVTSVEFEKNSSLQTIGNYAFAKTDITSITIPDSVTSIGYNAFYGCNNLQYNEYENALYLGNTNNPYMVLVQPKNKDILSCTINKDTKIICQNAFSYCNHLKSIEVSENNTEYASQDGILYDKSLTTIVYVPRAISGSAIIPNTITSIDGAFNGCSNLKSVTIPDSVKSISSETFSGCSNLENITVSENNTEYASQDGILYNKSKTKFVSIPNALSGSVTIPDGITKISSYNFSGKSKLTNITIPDSVTSIGSGAFSGCSNLESLTIPFVGSSLEVSNDNQRPFGYIFGEYSYDGGIETLQFDMYYKLFYRYYIPQSLKSVTVTGGIIPEEAFRLCDNITSITIGNNVVSIKRFSFHFCTKLQTIIFTGTVEQFRAIKKETYWHKDVLATKVICSDGEVTL